MFVVPFRSDIQHLTTILAGFGEVTGLVTNLQKCLVAPIRCADIDLDEVLQDFPVVRMTFPMRYLGLPLSVHRLKKIDFQHLVDKVAGRLIPWQGRLITSVGSATLVTSVLTAQTTHHITSLVVPAGTLEEINKLERAFL